MADLMKIRAIAKNGLTEVKVLMLHPMETGRRKNDAGEVVPAHFIQLVTRHAEWQHRVAGAMGNRSLQEPLPDFLS